MSIVRATVMMLELDYMSSFNEAYFDDKPSTLPYPSLTVFFILLFVLLMPILLVNLLVSLHALYDVFVKAPFSFGQLCFHFQQVIRLDIYYIL